jgi:hypothetical protein
MESNPTGGAGSARTTAALDEEALTRRLLAAKAIAVEAGQLSSVSTPHERRSPPRTSLMLPRQIDHWTCVAAAG